MFNEPKLTLTEYPDKHACESIYLHNDIWKNDKQKLFNYCNTIINDGKISIEYKKKGEYGRLYPSQYNTTYMWNKIRSTLFKNTDYDIDIVNCHPNIIKHIMETHYSGFPTPHLDNYINNRDEIIKQIKIKEDVINKYNKLKDEYLSCKDVIKRLFIIILYGGGIETWTNTFNLQSDDYSLCDYVKDFQQELRTISGIIIGNDNYSPIWKAYYKECLDDEMNKYYYGMTAVEKKKNPFDKEKFCDGFKSSRKLAIILQEIETRIILKSIQYVKKQGAIVTAYTYDGFQVLRDGFDGVDKLNDYISQDYKYIKFAVKHFNNGLQLEDIDLGDKIFNANMFYQVENYCYKKHYSEKFHFRILNPPCFIKLCHNKPPQYIKMSDLAKMYSHLLAHDPKDKNPESETSFVGIWNCDKNMRIYDNADIIPPPNICPKDTFNLWTEFPILDVPLDETADTSRLYTHLDYTANHDPKKKEYILNWFAQLLQEPGKKSRVALLIKGDEGSGKSIVAEKFLEKIIGLDKMNVTCDIDKILGKFSDSTGKLLTVLNEATGSDTFKLLEKLKDYITAETGIKEKKGIDAIGTKLYDRQILTTNNENSVCMKPGQRRWDVSEVDNSIKNNKMYFDKLHADLENPIIMRKFYQELMDRKLENWDAINDRVRTELTEVMESLNTDPMVDFDNDIGDILIKKYNSDFEDNKISVSANDLYKIYFKWWMDEGRNIDHKFTRTKFGTLFYKNTKLKVEKEKRGKIYYIFTLPEWEPLKEVDDDEEEPEC